MGRTRGAQEIGERVTDASVREVREETGLDIEVTGLSGIYSDPGRVIACDEGEVRQEFSLCFHARPTGGDRRTSSESKRVTWVRPSELDDLDIHPSMKLRIQHAIEKPDAMYLG